MVWTEEVMPVWSVCRPSRHDGFIVDPRCEPYWLVTVSGFQGSGAARQSPCFLRFSRRQSPTPRLGREGLLYAFLDALSTTSSMDLRRRMRNVSDASGAYRKRLPTQEAADGRPRHVLRSRSPLMHSSPGKQCYQEAPRVGSTEAAQAGYHQRTVRNARHHWSPISVYIPARRRSDETTCVEDGCTVHDAARNAARTASCPT